MNTAPAPSDDTLLAVARIIVRSLSGGVQSSRSASSQPDALDLAGTPKSPRTPATSATS